jgi:hypothetical protein
MSTETIIISELLSEFQKFVGKNENDLKRLLLQPTFSTKFMTRVMQEDSYKASKAVISEVVQGFQKTFTAKGTPTFTPIEIVHRRHKIDLSFYPDEIVGSWLGFLVTEQKNRTEWPITKYIIYNLIMDKVAEDRELKNYGTGVYAEPVTGVAQAAGLSMDGFCTILEAKKLAGTSNINFIDLEALTDDNIFTEIEKFADGISAVYKSRPMDVHLSDTWFTKYLRKRRDLYGGNTDYKGINEVRIDGTNMSLSPLPSMADKDIIFCTPKENFIWLTKVNDGASSLNIETSKREIIVYADWHENVGFGIEEAIFASVPDESSASV